MPDNNEHPDLWEAYRATTYRILADSEQNRDIRVDEPAPVQGPLAYVTPDNPGSRLLSDAENLRRRHTLAGELDASGVAYVPGKSIADDDQWPPEKGFWIAGITRDDARTLAMRYGQNAIVFVDAHRKVHLVDCRPRPPRSR